MVGKLKATGDGNRRDIAINEIMLKWNPFEHRCIKKEVPVEQSCGESSWDCSGEWPCLGASLKYFDANGCSMGNQQEELEVYVQLQSLS